MARQFPRLRQQRISQRSSFVAAALVAHTRIARGLSLLAFVLVAIAGMAVADYARAQAPAVDQATSADEAATRLAELKEVERQVIDVVKRVSPAVVCIEGHGGGSGSGVIVTEDGLVLTAAHVVENHGNCTVRYSDGRRFAAKRLGMFASRDAAMVQITEGGPHPCVEVGSSGGLKYNDWVIALGHPGGFDEERKTPLRIGHIIGNDHWLTTDCALIGGDSGGPSFDLQGRVVGIHSNIGGSISANNDVPSDVFLQQWQFMLDGKTSGTVAQALAMGRKQRSLLGLVFEDELSEDGAVVSQVHPDSPADDAGLLAGDIVTHLNGQPVIEPEALLRALRETPPGARVTLTIKRDDTTLIKRVRLTSEAEQQQRQSGAASPQRRETRDGEIVQPKSRLQQLLEQAKKNGGRLKLDREALAKLQAEMAVRMEQLAPIGGRPQDEWSRAFSLGFGAVSKSYEAYTLIVTLKQRPVALATVIADHGLAVTKHSEIAGREFEVQSPAGDQYEVEVIASADDLDLALLRISGYDGPAIELPEEPELVLQGTFCAATGPRAMPLGVGVISVAERSLASASTAVLGVETAEVDGELSIKSLQPGGAAEAAGLKVHDVIVAVDGKFPATQENLRTEVKSRLPGDVLRLEIRRGDIESSFEVTLGDLAKVAPMAGAREQSTDGMSTRRSKRRWAFRRGLQHDCAIQPKHCGGPLIGLNGELIGINIARAGRIRSYAIPTSLVRAFVDESLGRSNAPRAVSQPEQE